MKRKYNYVELIEFLYIAQASLSLGTVFWMIDVAYGPLVKVLFLRFLVFCTIFTPSEHPRDGPSWYPGDHGASQQAEGREHDI